MKGFVRNNNSIINNNDEEYNNALSRNRHKQEVKEKNKIIEDIIQRIIHLENSITAQSLKIKKLEEQIHDIK